MKRVFKFAAIGGVSCLLAGAVLTGASIPFFGAEILMQGVKMSLSMGGFGAGVGALLGAIKVYDAPSNIFQPKEQAPGE